MTRLGIEPRTYGLKVRCSNQLSYRVAIAHTIVLRRHPLHNAQTARRQKPTRESYSHDKRTQSFERKPPLGICSYYRFRPSRVDALSLSTLSTFARISCRCGIE